MQSISTATKKEFQAGSPAKGQFIIEPLYPGYGLTLGNALRRVLLSSLEGVAISAIRLKGVNHEFSTITGVKEDVVDIILNLKQIRFEVTGEFEEKIKIELSAKGSGEVKAGDFKKTAGVKIANPNLIIATLTDSQAEFELEAWLEKGRGYLPTEMMEGEEKEANVIAIDAIFTPIKKVAIDTENVRVGDMTNWDRLLLNLETDGTITPEAALDMAVKILVEQFSFLLEEAPALAKTAKSTTKKDISVPNSEELTAVISETVSETETTFKKKRGRPKKTETLTISEE